MFSSGQVKLLKWRCNFWVCLSYWQAALCPSSMFLLLPHWDCWGSHSLGDQPQGSATGLADQRSWRWWGGREMRLRAGEECCEAELLLLFFFQIIILSGRISSLKHCQKEKKITLTWTEIHVFQIKDTFSSKESKLSSLFVHPVLLWLAYYLP